MAQSLVSQPTKAPTRKVVYTAVAGAAFTVFIWVLKEFYGVTVPGDVQGTVHTALAGVIGYMMKDRVNV